MFDPRAAEVVRPGLLVVDLENAGWGLVDLDGAQATVPAPSADEAEPDDVARRDAEDALAQAEETAARDAAELESAEQALDAASTEQRRLADRKTALLLELREIETREERVAQDVRTAREARAAAAREVARDARLVTRARRHVEG